MDLQAFYTGKSFDAYRYFGAHPVPGGTRFAVWAPAAREVRLVTSGLDDGTWAERPMARRADASAICLS